MWSKSCCSCLELTSEVSYLQIYLPTVWRTQPHPISSGAHILPTLLRQLLKGVDTNKPGFLTNIKEVGESDTNMFI